MKRSILFYAIIPAILVLNSQVFPQHNYFQFGSLNQGSVTVSSSWTKLNTGTHSFTKSQNDTEIEVYVNSRFRSGTLSSANGVQFQVRIDDTIIPDFDNLGSIRTSDTDEFLSLYAVFENMSAGSHTVSIWAQAAPSGSSSGVSADPGGWGGKIIVKVVQDLTSVELENSALPDEFILQQNYPNPFNPSTTIRYSITTPENVSINIYDIEGKLINEIKKVHNQAGEYEVIWNGKNNFGERVSSGAYFYQIVVGDYVEAKKMILLK